MSRINSVKNDTNDVAIAIMDGRTVIGLFIIENKGGEADVKRYDVTFTGKDSKAWIRDLSGNDLPWPRATLLRCPRAPACSSR